MEAEGAWDAVMVPEAWGDAVAVAQRVGRGAEALGNGETEVALCRDGVALSESVAAVDTVCVEVVRGERDTRAEAVP